MQNNIYIFFYKPFSIPHQFLAWLKINFSVIVFFGCIPASFD